MSPQTSAMEDTEAKTEPVAAKEEVADDTGVDTNEEPSGEEKKDEPNYWDWKWRDSFRLNKEKQLSRTGYLDWFQSFRGTSAADETDPTSADAIGDGDKGDTKERRPSASYWDWKNSFRNNKAPIENGGEAKAQERRPSASYWDWRNSFRNNKSAGANDDAAVTRASWRESFSSIRNSIRSLGASMEFPETEEKNLHEMAKPPKVTEETSNMKIEG